MGTLASGIGSINMSQLLSFLDIKNTKSLSKRFMGNMESSIRVDLRKVATDSILLVIEEEVRLTINDEENFQEFKRNVKNKKQGIPITITIHFDMGWSKRSSGNRYDSLSGHALAIVVLTKSFLVVIVSGKLYRLCSLVESDNQEPPNHCCTKNYDGSSTLRKFL